MTLFIPILNAEVAPGAAVSSSLLTRLRDNLDATAEGAAGATPIYGGAISFGGSGIDGSLNNAYTFTGNGFYEFTDINVTTSKTFPGISILRVQGNVTISSTITVSAPTAAEIALASKNWGDMVVIGDTGGDNSGYPVSGAGSGGSVGAAGAGPSSPGSASTFNEMRNWFCQRKKYIVGGRAGGNGAGTDTAGGGVLVIIADGDVTLTGAVINAVGLNGSADDCGGGGGGTIFIVSAGSITDGTLNCTGGNRNGLSASGGGGGGLVARIAPTVTGGTVSVAGGSGAAGGGAGLNFSFSGVTPGELRTLFARF